MKNALARRTERPPGKPLGQKANQTAKPRSNSSPAEITPENTLSTLLKPPRERILVGLMISISGLRRHAKSVEDTVEYLQNKGFSTHVEVSENSAGSELEVWKNLLDMHCDQLIIHCDWLDNVSVSNMIKSHSNTVMVNRHIPRYAHQCATPDYEQSGELAADFLIARGHDRIAMVTGPRLSPEVQALSRGFRRLMSSRKLSLPIHLEVEGDMTETGGAAAMSQLIKSSQSFSAVFFHNDRMALGALETCRQEEINVPGDISILGFGNDDITQFSVPKLSSIRPGQLDPATLSIHLLSQTNGSVATQQYQAGELQCKSAEVNNSNCPKVIDRASIAPYASESDSPETFDKQDLTRRERQCIKWAALGKTSWETAQILDLSESTIAFHLRNVISKLNVANRTEAVAKSIILSIIHLD